MTETCLYLDNLNLSPYIHDGERGLIGLTLEMEQDIWRILHRSKHGSIMDFYMLGLWPTLFCSWRPPRVIFSCRYEGGRIRLNLGKGVADFYLINLNNEWWQPKKISRKPLTDLLQKRLF